MTFEPVALRPEVLPATSCVGNPAFGTRIIVIVNAGGIVVVRGVRFRFIDRFGLNTLPHVSTITEPAPLSVGVSTIPPLGPIPMPGVAPLPGAPLPLPGSGPGLMVPAGTSQRLPFFLRFDCGVAADGMLTVMTDLGKPDGAPETTEFRVRVGS